MQYEVRLLFVALVWGLNYKIIPYGIHELGAGPFTFWRFLLAVMILLSFLVIFGQYQFKLRDLPKFVGIGLIGTTAYQGVFAAGVARTGTVEAAMLFSLAPVFSVLLNAMAGRGSPKAHQIGGVILATIGTYIIVTRTTAFQLSDEHTIGNALMLASAFLWAFYAFVSERLLKIYGGVRVTAWSALFGTIGLGLISLPSLDPSALFTLSNAAIGSLAFAVLGATVFGVVMFYATVPHLGTQRVMMTMYLVPAIAIITDFVTGGSFPSVREWTGILMVFVGVILAKSLDWPFLAGNFGGGK